MPRWTTILVGMADKTASKKRVKVIARGEYPDSRVASRDYWLSRPPAERILAARALRRKLHLLLRRQEPPRLAKTIRRFGPRA